MVQVKTLSKIDEIFDVLRLSNVSDFGSDLPPGWVFRGHRDPKWQLIPQVWRHPKIFPATLASESLRQLAERASKIPCTTSVENWRQASQERFEEAILRCVVSEDYMERFLSLAHDVGIHPSTPIRTDWDNYLSKGADNLFRPWPHSWAPLAQHYGAPTELLDWTRDPLTALSFALEMPLNGKDAITSKTVSVWALDLRDLAPKGHKPDGRGVHIATGDPVENPYIRAQLGVFTYVSFPAARFCNEGKYPALEELIPERLIHFKIRTTAESRKQIWLRLIRERRTLAHRTLTRDSCAAVVHQMMRLFPYKTKSRTVPD